MLARGIRPKRTLVICSWDGEEYALTGSTEWGEQYADELKQKAVAYLNVDEATSGRNFQGDAVGSLAPLLVEVSTCAACSIGKNACMTSGKFTRKTELSLTQAVPDAELGEYADRERLGPYRFPEFSRDSDRGLDVHGPLRRLSLACTTIISG